MRLPSSAFTSRPWRVHEFTRDFEVEDVWRLPTPGGPDDLDRLVQQTATVSDGADHPAVFRALFALRWKLGALLGWDGPDTGVGRRVRSLRERLPADLLEGPRGPDLRAVPGRTAGDGPPIFVSIYQTHDEWLSEFCNDTVHSLMHIGWVPDESGHGHHAEMTVLTKPNGWLGKAYMTAIKPVRVALVYPMLLRTIERQWRELDERRPGARDEVRAYIGVDEVPAGLRALFPGEADYADAFRLPVEDVASAEEWARAMFGDEPGVAAHVVGTLLGERIARGRSPQTIAGARIAARGPDWVRLESPSWLLSGATVVHAADGQLTLAVFQRYDRARGLGRVVWTLMSPLHRRLAAPTLRNARVALRERRSTARRGVPASGAVRPA